jgi:glycosyltransferase involved in cell wall biosynthesis
MAQPLSVVFLTSARAWRGSGVSLTHIAAGLVGRGHRVHMLAGEESVVAEFKRRGLPASRVPTSDTGLRAAHALAGALHRVEAHCLITDRPRDLRLGALALLAHPMTLINRYNLSRQRPPRDLLSRLAYHRVGLTIFVSETNATQALEAAPYLRRRRYRVIAEGVGPAFHPDPAAAERFCARYGLVNDQFLLAVGSLTADKRYEFLFDALNRLGPKAPPLVICGAGPLAEQLQIQAAALNVRTRFLGLVSPEHLVGAYSAAMTFLHACEIETFGLSVLEAMACGRPVLAVAGGAVPEVVGDAGVLTPVNDRDAFAAALGGLLADPPRRAALSRAARERAQLFSLERMQHTYGEAIEQACSSHLGKLDDPCRSSFC